MTRPGIETLSPRPLVKTLTIMPIHIYKEREEKGGVVWFGGLVRFMAYQPL